MHNEKGEIVRLVDEMLFAGIIRDNQSAFSNLVLLVKKKDGNGWFYIDYRTFNSLTMKGKFLISIIKEILDELHGIIYFSKLDLCSAYHLIKMRVEDIYKTTF